MFLPGYPEVVWCAEAGLPLSCMDGDAIARVHRRLAAEGMLVFDCVGLASGCAGRGNLAAAHDISAL